MRIRHSATIVLAAFGLAAAAVSGYHADARQQQARTAQEQNRTLARAASLADAYQLDAAFAASDLGLAQAAISQIADRRRHIAQALAAFDDAKYLLPPESHPKLVSVIDRNRLRVQNALRAPPPASGSGPTLSQNTP